MVFSNKSLPRESSVVELLDPTRPDALESESEKFEWLEMLDMFSKRKESKMCFFLEIGAMAFSSSSLRCGDQEKKMLQ